MAIEYTVAMVIPRAVTVTVFTVMMELHIVVTVIACMGAMVIRHEPMVTVPMGVMEPHIGVMVIARMGVMEPPAAHTVAGYAVTK